MTNTLLVAKMMAEDTVSYYQTMHLMSQTQNKKELKLVLAFQGNSNSSESFSWRDISQSAFGGTPWNAPVSPIRSELAKLYAEDIPVEEQISLFFESNRSTICAEVTTCLAEEGYEKFTVSAEEGHLVIWASVM